MADRHLNIAPKKIKTYPPPPSTRAKCPDPLATFTAQQLTVLDPRSSRTRLFSKTNPDAAKLGDILLVRFKSGDPFAGVCMNIRRRGVDTSILLRAQLTRIGTEMWVKVYSPTVVGIEVVQRAEKRARRARLYHLRYVPRYALKGMFWSLWWLLNWVTGYLLIERLTGNRSMIAVACKASWMRISGKGAYWEGVMLVVVKGEGLILIRK